MSVTPPDRSFGAREWTLAVMLVLSSLVVLPALQDPVMLPKASVMQVGVLVLIALWGARVLSRRRIDVPVAAAPLAAGVLLLGLAVATATSLSPWMSLFGVYERYAGLLSYLTYVVVLLAVLGCSREHLPRLLTRSALLALGLTVGYAVLQAFGIEPLFSGRLDEGADGESVAFFGNVNFAGAWVGMLCGLCLTTALSATESWGWRVCAAVLLPGSVVAVVLTGTFQGPLVAAVSLVWAAMVFASGPDGVLRRVVRDRRAAVVASASAAVALLAVVAVLVAPTVQEQLDQSLVERPAFWSAAAQVFMDNPVVGTGPDTYRETFLANRPASHGQLVDRASADSPHSIPLGMLSGGGLVTALPYAAFVVLVGVATWRGARRSSGAERAAIASFGGIWWGYQVQSLISIDVPPLSLLHFLSAGVVIAVAGPLQWRQFVLPGAPAGQRVTRRGVPVGEVVVPTSTRALQATLVVALVVSSWLLLAPLRADVAASRALAMFGTDDPRAVAGLERAESANPGESSYSSFKAMTLAASGQPDRAYAAAVTAADRSPGSSRYALLAGRLAADRGDAADAAAWFREAARRDPYAGTVQAEVGQGLLQVGEQEDALPILRRAVELRPEVRSIVLLAQAMVLDGDPEEARPLLDRALELQPGEPNATRLLESLNAPGG